MTALFLDDGMTFAGSVAPRPGIHPGLKFRYRPALPERVQSYINTLGKSDKQLYDAKVRFVLDHLVDWEADAPADEKNLRRLRLQVLGDLAEVIAGYAASAEPESDEKNSSPPGRSA